MMLLELLLYVVGLHISGRSDTGQSSMRKRDTIQHDLFSELSITKRDTIINVMHFTGPPGGGVG